MMCRRSHGNLVLYAIHTFFVVVNAVLSLIAYTYAVELDYKWVPVFASVIAMSYTFNPVFLALTWGFAKEMRKLAKQLAQTNYQYNCLLLTGKRLYCVCAGMQGVLTCMLA